MREAAREKPRGQHSAAARATPLAARMTPLSSPRRPEPTEQSRAVPTVAHRGEHRRQLRRAPAATSCPRYSCLRKDAAQRQRGSRRSTLVRRRCGLQTSPPCSCRSRRWNTPLASGAAPPLSTECVSSPARASKRSRRGASREGPAALLLLLTMLAVIVGAIGKPERSARRARAVAAATS